MKKVCEKSYKKNIFLAIKNFIINLIKNNFFKMTVRLKNAPARFSFKEETIEFNTFAEKFIEYMEELADLEAVKNEMHKKQNFTSLEDLKKELGV